MSLFDIEPLFDRVILRRIENQAKYANLIHFPDGAKIKSCMAEVIHVGPGRIDASGERVKMQLQPGDLVLIGRYAGVELELMTEDGKTEKFLSLVEDEVYGKLTRKPLPAPEF